MKMLKYTTALQSGRSMMEMLGVLAVIGVLSIGGIAGYSYGMDKYRANTIINDVNLRAIDLIAQANRGGDLSLSEWPAKTAGNYDIGLEVDTATNTTEGGVFVDGVPNSICEIIGDNLNTLDIDLTVNGTDYVSGNCSKMNKIVFYYNAVSGLINNNDAGQTDEDVKELNPDLYCITDLQCYGTGGEGYCGWCGSCVDNQCVYEEGCINGCSKSPMCGDIEYGYWDYSNSVCVEGCPEYDYCQRYGRGCGYGCNADGTNCREGSCVDECADGWTWGFVAFPDSSPGGNYGCWKDNIGCVKGRGCYDTNGNRVSDFREESIK